MPTDPSRPWDLYGFDERFAAWADLETADERLRQVVKDWIDTRALTPYLGTRPDPLVEGLSWVKIPGTLHKGNDFLVVCGYWIDESKHEVRCDSFGSAPWTV